MLWLSAIMAYSRQRFDYAHQARLHDLSKGDLQRLDV